ncbi:hypothetical protein ACFRR7_13930 [Streptomyces sp. NPDC056909]|uniref:hypothetical protein n=1 Tax=Streptomyces sp. NPDC056909 TaxID=3345963 RepID=UPI003678A91C
MAAQELRARLEGEASRILDDRLDLAREAAPWNVATFGTLTVASVATAAVLALTGLTWWIAAPLALAAVCLRFVMTAVRELRGTRPRRVYRPEE